MMLSVFCDGGARGNPGPAATGVVIKNKEGKLLYKLGRPIGMTTNNVAEYQAVIDALGQVIKIAKNWPVEGIQVFVDSQLVAQQLAGNYKVRDAKLKTLFNKVKQLEESLPKVTYYQIRRNQNKEADFLVNKALNLGDGIESSYWPH